MHEEVSTLKVLKIVFQEPVQGKGAPVNGGCNGKMVLVLDMEGVPLETSAISDLTHKMEVALPGIFPDDESRYAHMCGTGEAQHTFREEIERGTTVPHLLEHVILHLLSRTNENCVGYSGQRSVDLERGITSHHYIVIDYKGRLDAIVALDLALQLVSAWAEGRTVRVDPDAVLGGITQHLSAMLRPVML